LTAGAFSIAIDRAGEASVEGCGSGAVTSTGG